MTKGIFTKEIEEALAAGRVDLAVHSSKTCPLDFLPNSRLPPFPSAKMFAMPSVPLNLPASPNYLSMPVLGTSSLRRQAQLKALRPNVETIPLRGNVDTRLRKLATGDYDAIILAAAGLNRLGQAASIRQLMPIDVMCPAAGQGGAGHRNSFRRRRDAVSVEFSR